jgi:predicted site-specific integrase-resolvase
MIQEIRFVATEIDGQVYYRTSEACRKSGVSRATLFRWLKAGILEKHYKDRRGWRMFTEEDLNTIRAEARKIKIEYVYPREPHDKNGRSHEQPDGQNE